MDFTPDMLAIGLVWFVAFLFSTTVHEASHALVALKLGDPTAYSGGQVSLNPVPHIQREPIGMVVVPIVSYLLAHWMMGWASAPYDPWWADRHPRRAAWMALAGPVSNLGLFAGSALLIRLGMALGYLTYPERLTFTQITMATASGALEAVATLLSVLFTLNLLLCIFNLLPLPPLDGSGVLPLVMPVATAQRYQEFMRQPTFSLLGIFVAWKVVGEIFWPVLLASVKLLYPGVTYG